MTRNELIAILAKAINNVPEDEPDVMLSQAYEAITGLQVTVEAQDVMEEETRVVAPDFSGGNMVITPTANKVMTQVTITKDAINHVAGNIKKGVTLYGIAGTYEGDGGGFDVYVSSNAGGAPTLHLQFADGTSGTYYDDGTYHNVVWLLMDGDLGPNPSSYISGMTVSDAQSGSFLTESVTIYSDHD